jgi:hypothetical protein
MSEEVQAATDAENSGPAESTETQSTESLSTPSAPVETTNQTAPVVSGDTNDAINASLDSISDPAVLKGMVTRLRHENGNHRKRNTELNEANAKLEAWKLAHNKSVAEANERTKKAEDTAKQYVIKAALIEYDVDEDLADLVDGKTEEEIWNKAAKLANTKKNKPSWETPTNVDLFGGRRGTPVEPAKKDPGGDWFKEFMK